MDNYELAVAMVANWAGQELGSGLKDGLATLIATKLDEKDAEIRRLKEEVAKLST